jgi:hypothetical protein
VAALPAWYAPLVAPRHGAVSPHRPTPQVRLPIAQACLGTKWKASCGLTHDIGNTFIAGLSDLLDARLANLSAGALSGSAPWGVDVVRYGAQWGHGGALFVPAYVAEALQTTWDLGSWERECACVRSRACSRVAGAGCPRWCGPERPRG